MINNNNVFIVSHQFVDIAVFASDILLFAYSRKHLALRSLVKTFLIETPTGCFSFVKLFSRSCIIVGFLAMRDDISDQLLFAKSKICITVTSNIKRI
jgi:hypothetical protein